MQIQLTRSPSREDVAETLARFSVEPDADCELTLPSAFVAKLPFEYADYMQLILTWAARPGINTLRVHANGPAAARAQLKGDHIQVAAALANRIVDLAREDVTIDVSGETEVRLRLKRAIQPRAAGVRAPVDQSIIETTRFSGQANSPDLTAPDRDGTIRVGYEARSLYGWVWPASRFETLLPYAAAGEALVGTDGDAHLEMKRWPNNHPYLAAPGEKVPFRPLADRLVTIHESARKRTRQSFARRNRPEDDLGAALWELAQNAHFHGARDRRDTGWLADQTRVVRTMTRRFSRDDCAAVASAEPALAGWMSRHLDRAQADSSEMAVIDVIDNGIGLAQRAASLLGEYGDLDERQEFDFLRRALDKSTRQGRNVMSAEGLGRVQLLMTNLGGAVSIRTGRLAVFRDFLRTPYKPDDVDLFLDWIPPENVPGRPPRRGSVVTIIIPTR